ncbi:MAG: hypothetical protein APU95_00300 [Hadesarchaea archaeon YNP_N21]|nr:MAG: hypothetical protein APU95_00300 [Hadesarchaea archaeon YNP_N21]
MAGDRTLLDGSNEKYGEIEMKRADLVVENARVVTPIGIFEGGIAVEGGRICAVAKDPLLPPADSVIDAGKKILMPGAVDAHTHVYLPGFIKETFKTGTMAAAVGGTTTIIEMPSTDTNTVKNFEERRKIAEGEAIVDFALHSGEIQEERDTLEISGLVRAGTTGFKITMGGGSTAARHDGIILESFMEIGKTGSIAIVHAENHQLYEHFRRKIAQEGRNDPSAYSDSRPNIVEAEAISRAILFARFAGNRLHIAHMTTKEGVELVRDAKDRGQPVTSEVTPQALLLNKNDYLRYKHYIVYNPPARDEEDNLSLWNAINEKIVDCIVTDHCAYTKEEKDVGIKNILETPPGIPGLETKLTLMLSEGVNKGRISLMKLVELCCESPAKIFGIFPRKGAIQVGSDADFLLVDIEKEDKISVDKLRSVGEFTPFEGWRTKGWPVLTVVRGEVVAEDGEVVGKPGYGKFIPSSLASREINEE